jgi:hypothetical protein
VSLEIKTSVASLGTEIVKAKLYDVLAAALNTRAVISAGLVPLTFAIISELILNTFPEPAELVTIAVALVVMACPSDFAVIVDTFTIFGAAMFYPPKTIAIAIVLPVVTLLLVTVVVVVVGCGTSRQTTLVPLLTTLL